MKTQANNTQTINGTTATDPTRRIGLVRSGMTVALMALAIAPTALGVAAISHADTGAQAPHTHVGTTDPSKATPPRRTIDGFGRGAPGYHPTPHHRRAHRNHSH